MHIRTNPALNKIFQPLIYFCEWLGEHHPIVLAEIRYYARFKKKLNLKNPQTLNEKILYLSLKTDTTLWTRCADKYAVRGYVEEKGLKDILIPLIGVWDKVEDVDFDKLPKEFVIKANHGSGDVVIVTDKAKLDWKSTVRYFHEDLNHKYGALESAHHYLRIQPKLIAEKLMDFGESNSLVDYKMWCFNGKCQYIMTCSDRKVTNGHETVVLKVYDRDWVNHPDYMVYDNDHVDGNDVPKPINLDEMIDIAERLSKDFPCVRVDLYNVGGKIYFGELTFTSYGGLMNYYSDKFQLLAGSMIDLSSVKAKR